MQALQQQLRAKDDAMAQMQDRLAGLEQEVRHRAALVQSLEADLLHASQNAGKMPEPDGPAENSPPEGGASKEPPSSGGASASLLSIVTSQRDRFRGRYAIATHSSEVFTGGWHSVGGAVASASFMLRRAVSFFLTTSSFVVVGLCTAVECALGSTHISFLLIGLGGDTAIGQESSLGYKLLNSLLLVILAKILPFFSKHECLCRVEQLEGDMGAVRGELAAARTDLAAARADNVKLYEKIRYLQRFSGKHAASDGFQVVQVDSEGISHPKVTPPAAGVPWIFNMGRAAGSWLNGMLHA